MRLEFLPRFILRDAIYYSNLLSMALANLFIRPLKFFGAKKLREEVKAGTIRKVLVNRSDQIGDAVVSLKIISALAEKFGEVSVVVSEKNKFVFQGEKKIKLVMEKGKPLYQRQSLFSKIAYFFTEALASPFRASGEKAPEYDLIIDLIGDFSIKDRHPSRHIIGPNRGPFSLFYSCFYRTSFAASGMHLLDAYHEMISDCLGIKLALDDLPPADFSKKKKRRIFVFTGSTPDRNLSYEKWKEIIEAAAEVAPCAVADDPAQLIMNQLKSDPGIKGSKRIELIFGGRELDELAKIANESSLLIALDGGGEHYLERYTNALVIYTCGLPAEWKPYSLNPYKQILLEKNHICEETTTSSGLKKAAFYVGKGRKPCYDFLCEYPEWKNLDTRLLADILERF